MKCPFCGTTSDRVVDSRESGGGSAVRRRRECAKCTRRYTTYEQVESVMPFVIKRDGRRESYDRSKVVSGLRKACQKRPVSAEQIERTADEIERSLQATHEKELSSRRIGEAVVNHLRDLDEVAYVRFASVYHEFKDVAEFQKEIDRLRRMQRARGLRFDRVETAGPKARGRRRTPG